MTSVGPRLPSFPRLEKRKRDDNDKEGGTNPGTDSGSDSDPNIGPAPSKISTPSETKRVRVIGPSLPPPSEHNEKPGNVNGGEESSDEEDGFGPSLPPSNRDISVKAVSHTEITSPGRTNARDAPPKRDDWMMVPPSGGDWTGRVDPTKLKNRKFNTGKGAKGPPSVNRAESAAWHETPQQKQERLQREIMGIKDTSGGPFAGTQSIDSAADAETAKRMKEYNKSRGPSLYDAHQSNQSVEQDDDPSARAFDREKDIGGGLQINATKRRDMMRKAADFSSRFSTSKYL